MSAVPVVRIVPCEAHQCPGFDFVEINESDFDPQKHKLFQEGEAKKATANELRADLTARGIEFKTSASKAELQALFDAA